jgi:folylpolyglutamate synthase/dihydropteroate synthase
LHCCSPAIERAMDASSLHETCVKKSMNAVYHDSVEEAIDHALQSGNRALITGSFYLAEEAVIALEKRGVLVSLTNHRPEGE